MRHTVAWLLVPAISLLNVSAVPTNSNGSPPDSSWSGTWGWMPKWWPGIWGWPGQSGNEKPPVCIVGAGPAGLIAANRLEGKGYETVIFEKQPEVGGKSQEYYQDGNHYPLGAAFYSNASYPDTVKVIAVTDVIAEPFSLATGRQQFNFNYSTGAIMPRPGPSIAFEMLVAAEIPRYIGLWETVFAPYSVPGYKNGVPENLTVSTVEWFKTNGFVALPILIVDPLALYGYGDVRIVPILYTLQYLTPDILTAFAGLHDVYFIDFHKVFVEWTAKSVNGTIHTSANVTSIDRSGEFPIIKYSAAGTIFKSVPGTKKRNANHQSGGNEQKCSQVIIAFPPTSDNLAAAGLDLTAAEQEVFSTVGVHNYFSSAVQFNLPYGVSYIEESPGIGIPPPNVGEPVAALQFFPTSDIATVWSWGPYRQFISVETAYNLLKTTLSKINKDPRDVHAMSEPVTDQDVKEFRKWDYFPHFDSPQLADGFYAKFNALQGSEKTYWASGLNGMETVEWAIRAGQDVANSYF